MLISDHGFKNNVMRRTKEFAESLAKRDVYEWRSRLHKHVLVGRISSDQAEAIIEAERLDAEKRYYRERYQGKHNDRRNHKAGFVAYITDEAKRHIEQALDIAINPLGFKVPSFEQMPELSLPQNKIYAMEMPSGGYNHSSDSTIAQIDLYPEPITGENGYIQAFTGPKFSIHPHTILRIEGSDGELWQNPDFEASRSVQE